MSTDYIASIHPNPEDRSYLLSRGQQEINKGTIRQVEAKARKKAMKHRDREGERAMLLCKAAKEAC